ncbi:glycosyltransferase [Parabacteroides sp.]|uniref:glycosyltransferase n=1 Tax=Parabacteroides sp. TaxID=1869337 RepID=UPI00259B40D2|nr:glycosyltransferase [uncultured Parabacteroides sp.]
MKQFKILHCLNYIDLSMGGPSRSVPSLCLALKKEGIQSIVLSHNSLNANVEMLRDTGIDLLLKDPPVGLLSKVFDKVYADGFSLNGTIVHLQHIWSPSLHYMARRCRKEGIPYLVSPRGSLEPWSMRQKKLKKNLGMMLYQREDIVKSACIHATANSERDNIRALGFKNPIAVIPNGINIENYPIKEFKKKDGKKTILFLSRIHPKKGLDLLFEAWSQIPYDTRRTWQIKVAGEGNLEYGIEDLNALVLKKYLNIDIEIIGPQYGQEKIKCYHDADIFVLPTHSENFGMVIAEAMCCGVPVITTTGTPWAELRDQDLGWYIDLSVDNLKVSLTAAMNCSDEERFTKGKKSRDLILNEYSVEAISYKYKLLYGWIAGECDQPEFIY